MIVQHTTTPHGGKTPLFTLRTVWNQRPNNKLICYSVLEQVLPVMRIRYMFSHLMATYRHTHRDTHTQTHSIPSAVHSKSQPLCKPISCSNLQPAQIPYQSERPLYCHTHIQYTDTHTQYVDTHTNTHTHTHIHEQRCTQTHTNSIISFS